MAAADYSFTIEKGTAFVISFEYKDDNNNAINLTNWCARLRWKDNNDAITTFNSNHTGTDYEFVIEPLTGKITLKIPASVTAAYSFTNASYDLELQEPNDLYSGGGKKVFRILQGTITTIERNVSDTDAFNCNFDSQDDCETC
tara:strand:- start:153 stop:581 length:429 start_codon:yes stop_codon:yes gene_type:complete